METMRTEPILARAADEGPQDTAVGETLAGAIDRLQVMISHLEDRLGPIVIPTEQLLVSRGEGPPISALGDRILQIEAQTERLGRLIDRLDIRV